MWIIIPAAAGALAFLAIHFGVLPPPHARTIIRIKAGMISVSRGQLRGYARQDVTNILLAAGIDRGFIAITPNDRVMFSSRIPRRIHQRLRNVLLNQHS